MSALGSLAIYFSLYLAICGIALGVIAAVTKSRRFLYAARFATFAVFGSITVALAVLLHAFLTHDFSIQYVAGFSDRTMPTFYLIGALWGGQAGSLLFWAWKAILFVSLCVYINRERYQHIMPWLIAVCLSVVAALLVIVAFGSNPFEGYQLIDDPSSGSGLNPLLQTPLMMIHPPFLLTGMASMTVPFGFAMAALLSGRLDNTWVEAARKWILIPWLMLTIGNILGGMWAYQELGWGGYWAWDPVENAALLPWLTSTALIHSLLIQERRGMLKRWNIGLMLGTFLLTLFGTYITRSGLIESIHSFAQSDIGPYFLTLLLTFSALSLALFVWRWKSLRAEQRLDSPVSREAAFIFNNWMFLSMAGVVLFGTLWPRIKEWTTGMEVAMGPPWFNRWMIPLGLLMLLMMGVGTIIAWRRANWRNFHQNFVLPIAITAVLTPVSISAYWMLRGRDLGVTPDAVITVYAISAVAFCIFVAAATLQEFYRGMAARRRAHDESWGQSLVRLCMKQKRRYGGYVVHLGVVFAFLAFAGNSMKVEEDVSLSPGDTYSIGDYTLTYQGLEPQERRDQTLYVATLPVMQDGKHKYTIHPGKAVFRASEEMPVSEIDIRSTPLEDLYVALVNFEPRNGQAVFKVFVSPFTWFFWFGGVMMVLGTLICLWPTRQGIDSLRPGHGHWGQNRWVRGSAFGFLVLLSLSPLAIWAVESHTDWGSAKRYELIADADADAADLPAEGSTDRNVSEAT